MSDGGIDGTRAVAAWRALLLAHASIVTAVERDLAAAGRVPLAWYDLLLEVEAGPEPLRMCTLADGVTLSRTRVSRLVSELEDAGLVERTRDPDDGRARRVSITDAGVRARRAAWPVYRDSIERHVGAHLDDARLDAVVAGLQRLVSAHTPPTPLSPRRRR